ncbi:amidophosphoribosyltransferase [Brachyspira sp.]|uniref:amidophosphoribosyltransferase n=1 Tax=Brachyspira sp. TaxID=1977261 RepID=UPI003D7E897B
MPKIKEECGVFGVYGSKNPRIAQTVYFGLFSLQHRGQESCGIAVNNDGVFKSYKDLGLVNDVFTPNIIEKLGEGNIAVGHVRYGTTGGNERSNAQPIVVNHIKGSMALAHNGNITNSYELRSQFEAKGSIFQTTSDTEVISYAIIEERLNSETIEEAVCKAMNRIKGAYSMIIMSPQKLIAARDKNGFRPLCYGKTANGEYIIASESCALDSVGAEFVRDIEKGEILVFGKEGIKSIKEHCGKGKQTSCVFEYVYFARPDSIIEGKNVHEARIKAGEILAKEHPVKADVVVGVPDSGLDAALGYSKASKIPYGIGFIKNKYIGRTFIYPEVKSRMDKVKIKLNPIANVVNGKRVILIDDSIVRGTTSERIVKLLRDAGATEVHMRVSAPPFINPCYYGTDIDSKENLIACKYTIEEIAKKIGADSLGYLSLEGVKKIGYVNEKSGFCTACFDGIYPTEIPTKTDKNRFERKINHIDEEK